MLSIVKDMWEQVGVTLNLEVRESAVFYSVQSRKTHKEMFVTLAHGGNPFKAVNVLPGNMYNMSMVDDPHENEWLRQVSEAYYDDTLRRQIVKDDVIWKLEQSMLLPIPSSRSYTCWQPWLKGYNGEYRVGYMGTDDYTGYVWLDLDLKEAVTGSR